MNKFLPVIFILLIAAALGYFFINNQKITAPIPLTSGGTCDPETMTCSDGAVLKKEGPNCDFPPCPEVQASSSTELSSSKVTVSGTIICLPHKNTTGPQTLECAFGIKAQDGNNYGLTDPEWKFLMGVTNGEEVEIGGKLIKKEDSRYISVGVIEIETLTKK